MFRLFVLVGLVAGACTLLADEKDPPKEDKSIVLGKAMGKVQNGSAYDVGTLDMGKLTTLYVPQGAEVISEGEGTKVQVYVKKTQGFFGRPPEPMDIAKTRKHFGVATLTEEKSITLATFGEFSTKEGGASIKLVIVAPKALTIETKEGLHGDSSAARPSKDEKLKRVRDPERPI